MATLLFYKGTKAENPEATLLDRFICYVTKSKYSHVELSLGTPSHYLRNCISASTRDGGVRVRLINVSSDHWDIAELDETVDYEWVVSQVGKKYDWVGLLSTVLRTPILASNDKWFCSELIATALNIKKPYLQTPESIFRMVVRK